MPVHEVSLPKKLGHYLVDWHLKILEVVQVSLTRSPHKPQRVSATKSVQFLQKGSDISWPSSSKAVAFFTSLV